MPGHKEHIVIGAVVSAVVYFLVHHWQLVPTDLGGLDWAMIALITYLYSQLPDIDQDVSVINKIWNTTAGIVGVYCIYTGQFRILGLFAVASIVALEWVKHRGVTHEEWFGLAMAAPLWFVNPLFAIIGATTYISHIWADGDAFH